MIPMRLHLVSGLLVVLGLDLLFILVSGHTSILLPGATVSPLGFGVRAVVIGVVLAWRFWFLPEPGRRLEGGRLILLLLLLPTLLHFQVVGSRLNGDGTSYYVFLRSLMKDGDFDLTNEYAHYGMLTRWDIAIKTKTGLRRSIYSVGPAVVWAPFFVLGDGVARVQAAITGDEPDLSGYGRVHLNAVALGSVLYGFGALLLIHGLLLRYFSAATSLGAVLLLWGTTFFQWYLVVQPMYAHSASTFFAAYVLWLWDRHRSGGRDGWDHVLLGLIVGLAMSVRWQNGVFLFFPAVEMAMRLGRDRKEALVVARDGLLLGAGVLIGAFPQMAAWKALYDEWLLPCPPHGCDFVRLDHPWILETLFASRHGLLSWTPALWAGYLGLLPLARRRPALVAILAVPLLVTTYVNLCAGDWWAGASFSNRRFDSVLPILAFGFAASIDALRTCFERRPSLAMALAIAPFAAWNLATTAAARAGLLDPPQPTSFPRQAGAAAQVVSDAIGFPTTWPASWLFAWRHGLSPGRYDLTVGRYLFYRQNSYGEPLVLADSQVEPLLAGAWGPSETIGGVMARCTTEPAMILAPLDVPEDLELRFEATAPGEPREAAILVNGRPAGRLAAAAAWDRASIPVASSFFHREINAVTLAPLAGSGPICISSVDFVRARKKGQQR